MRCNSRMPVSYKYATSPPQCLPHPWHRCFSATPAARVSCRAACAASSISRPDTLRTECSTADRQSQPFAKANQLVSAAARSIAIAAVASLAAGSCHAADFAKVGACLFQNCPVPLAKCIADKTCAENIVCLNSCNGRPDESECQIRCGDLYASPAVEEFNKCAVTEKKCVPQRRDDNKYPVPPDDTLDNSFDLAKFQGKWAITAGLNDLFDTFNCQVHQFTQEADHRLRGDIYWRIKKSDGDFLERSGVQTFDQDPKQPGHLHNGNNDFLSYTDDWYILGFKPDAYAVIYYIGNNDAWLGYGGATVYTRELAFPEKYRKDVENDLEKIGLRLDDFRFVDNSCPPHPKVSEIDDIEGTLKDLVPGANLVDAPPVDIDESKTPRERAGLEGPRLREDYEGR